VNDISPSEKTMHVNNEACNIKKPPQHATLLLGLQEDLRCFHINKAYVDAAAQLKHCRPHRALDALRHAFHGYESH
jgi:hypothetical protein